MTNQELANKLHALADIWDYWLAYKREERATEGLETTDDTHVITVPPHWPTIGNLQAWIDTVQRAATALTSVEPAEPLKITEADAKVIIGMDEVCYNEGIGPDATDLLRRIYAEWPSLIEPCYDPWCKLALRHRGEHERRE